MTKTYDQQCPIAMALDVVGDRWALLVVRELMLGPLRFGEIAAGLPGVGSRQLTERLKFLSEQGVIEPLRLAEAGDAPGYALTPRGRGLAPSLAALAAWGLELWRASPQGAASPTSVALMLWARAASDGGSLRLLAQVVVEGVAFRYAFTDDGVKAWRGRSGGDPGASLTVSERDALGLLSGQLAVDHAVSDGLLKLQGDAGLTLAQLLFGAAA